MTKNTPKINITEFLRVVLIILAIIIVGLCVFFFFKTRTEAKNVLREAKNVRMALRTTDIEMYAREKTIYDPNKVDGLADGVADVVESLVQPEGTYAITSYSYKKHEMTGMTYRKGHYYVIFKSTDTGINWDVVYMMRIYQFDEEDTKIVKK